MKTVFLRISIRVSLFATVFFAMLLSFSSVAKAQMYGTGYMPGIQACPYKQEIGDEAESVKEDIRDRKETLKELVEEQKEAKSKKRELERKLKTAKDTIERRGLQGEFLEKIIDHIENMRSCSEYEISERTAAGYNSDSADNETRMPANANDKDSSDQAQSPAAAQAQAQSPGKTRVSVQPFTAKEWNEYVCEYDSKGVARTSSCGVSRAQVSKGAFNAEICRTNLKTYQESKIKLRQSENEVASLEGRIAAIKEEISALNGTYKQAVREHLKEQRQQATEGGCIECAITGNGYTYQKPKSDWGSVIQNVILGGASILAGSSAQRDIAEKHARLGGRTDTFPAFGYGLPFAMAAMNAATGGGGQYYGAVNGGTGAGGFGCSNGNGQNNPGGVFGYPPGYYPTPNGGGIFSGYQAAGYPGGFQGDFPGGGYNGGGFNGGGFNGGGFNGGGFQGGAFAGGFGGAFQGGGFNGGGFNGGGFNGGGFNGGGFNGGGYSRQQENAANNEFVLRGLYSEVQATYQRYTNAVNIVRSGGYLGFDASFSGSFRFGGSMNSGGNQPAFTPGMPSGPGPATGSFSASTPSTR